MFTGIIEAIGEVTSLSKAGSNLIIEINSEISPELKINQSITHNGICLSVSNVNNEHYEVTAVEETTSRSNLGMLKEGDKINLERAMHLNDRLDGHLVQGHVDQIARVTDIEDKDGSFHFSFKLDGPVKGLMIEKGSITINGVSLTLTEVNDLAFTIAIIPLTFEKTNFNSLQVGDAVNIEFDLIGKYVEKMNRD